MRNEERVDQDRHHRNLRPHLQQQHRHHHQHDQMILFDEEVRLIHVIDIPDDNTTVNDQNDIIPIIIIDDDNDHDLVHEDGEFPFDFLFASEGIIRDYLNQFIFPRRIIFNRMTQRFLLFTHH